MAEGPLERITRELRARPLLIAGGGALLLIGATLISRGQDGAAMGDAGDQPADEADLEAGGDLAADSGGTLGFGSAYTLPSYSGGSSSGTYYDPFTADPATGAPSVTTPPPDVVTPPPATQPKPKAPSGPRITIARGKRFHYYRRDPRTGRYVSVGTRTAGSAVTWATGQPVNGRTAGGSSIALVQLRSGPLSGYWVGRGVGAWQR